MPRRFCESLRALSSTAPSFIRVNAAPLSKSVRQSCLAGSGASKTVGPADGSGASSAARTSCHLPNDGPSFEERLLRQSLERHGQQSHIATTQREGLAVAGQIDRGPCRSN